jgi:hypothetical protein
MYLKIKHLKCTCNPDDEDPIAIPLEPNQSIFMYTMKLTALNVKHTHLIGVRTK